MEKGLPIGQVRAPFYIPVSKMGENPDYGTFIVGGTRFLTTEWLEITITHDPWVIKAIKGIKFEFDQDPCQTAEPEPYWMSGEKGRFIDGEIDRLKQLGVLEKCCHAEGQCISNIFLKPKPNGKFRIILDLSDIKADLTYQHFKMVSLTTAMDIMQPGGYMASLDLADAYYSVPITREDRKFLRLKWKGELIQYTCLPNGLAQAPRNFTKILKPIFAHLASEWHISFGYIDDTFIWGNTFKECELAVERLRAMFVKLGFKIQTEKSVFVPTREITFLGFVLNSVTMKVYPTREKIEKGLIMLREFRAKKLVKIRLLATLIGTLNDLTKGCEYGMGHYRFLERDKTRALASNKGNFEAQVCLSDRAKLDLAWWILNLSRAERRIWVSLTQITLTTDACDYGWGAVYQQQGSEKQHTNGVWSSSELNWHINAKETAAVGLGLRSFARDLYNTAVKCEIDNTTAVAYINH